MSTEKLRELAHKWAVGLETEGDHRHAQILHGLCAEIARLEKENGALRSGLKRFCECPGSYHTKCKACEIAADALQGEGGKG